jgi:hypothetical protein
MIGKVIAVVVAGGFLWGVTNVVGVFVWPGLLQFKETHQLTYVQFLLLLGLTQSTIIQLLY